MSFPGVMLADKYSEKINVINYFVEEKFDGTRALFNKGKFYSRNANVFEIPEFFYYDFPDECLDGELWAGRREFNVTGLVRKNLENLDANDMKKWKEDMLYVVYDLPLHKGTYEERRKRLEEICACCKYIKIPDIWRVTSLDSLMASLKEYEDKKAEGLMLKNPKGLYKDGRSKDLLKLKSCIYDDAKIIGYKEGNGRNAGRVGSFIVEYFKEIEGKDPLRMEFNISGMNDELRNNPPPIDTIITFKYYDFTSEKENAKPRQPIFLRIRDPE